MLKRRIKSIIIIVGVLIVLFITLRYYINHGGKRDIQSEVAVYSVSSNAIVTAFTSNTEASNKKYLEKPIAVTGTVTSVRGKEVILDNSVTCYFLTALNSLKKDQKVTVKGRVVGFDDLLGEVKLDQCNLSINK